MAMLFPGKYSRKNGRESVIRRKTQKERTGRQQGHTILSDAWALRCITVLSINKGLFN